MSKGEQRRSRRVPGHLRAAEEQRAALPQQEPRRPLWRRPPLSVFVAFCTGLFVMYNLYEVPLVSVALFVLGVFGVAFGLSRLTTRALFRTRPR
ncbi:MAG: hypothetical protein EXR43_02540 [Dehalococcoidia bacterium]|nr:hypothetical protein [Dehalococcoidia bacterium]